jgi:hypothetical protein
MQRADAAYCPGAALLPLAGAALLPLAGAAPLPPLAGAALLPLLAGAALLPPPLLPLAGAALLPLLAGAAGTIATAFSTMPRSTGRRPRALAGAGFSPGRSINAGTPRSRSAAMTASRRRVARAGSTAPAPRTPGAVVATARV